MSTFGLYFLSMISSSEKFQSNATLNKHNLTGDKLKLTDELDFGRCQLSVSEHIILWFFQLWEGKESNEMKVEKPLLKIWTIYGAC